MGYSFSQQQCIKALLKIGFTDASKRRAKHYKYKPPDNCGDKFEQNIRPFITVPKHDFYCQDAIVGEIVRLCGEKMKQKFLDNL
jgi:hypothetical protein